MTLVDEKEIILVDWEENDPDDPFNWAPRRKLLISCVTINMTLYTAWCAVSFAWGVDQISAEFDVSRLVALLGITVFTFGFGLAPMALAPLSEVYGRNPVYLITFGLFVLMFIPQALTPNIYGLLISRCLSGLLCSTGSTMVGGTLSDIYRADTRGGPMAFFSSVTLYGTAIGSIVSAYTVSNPRLGWRWIWWIQFIINAVHFLILLFVLRETRAPVLLARKAAKLRRENHDDRYRASSELERASLGTLIRISLTRPFTFLFLEPAVLAYAIWVSFAWGVLYLFLEAVPIVFTSVYGFTQQSSSLAFIGMIIGTSIALGVSPMQDRIYSSSQSRPEARLYASMVGSILFTVGLFIFGWCAYKSIHWSACIVGIALASFGIFTIYLAVFNVLADTYGTYASSALAAQSFMRNVFASAFPLFGEQLYARLGVHWASSLLGFIALGLTAVPFILYIFGERIRNASKYVTLEKT